MSVFAKAASQFDAIELCACKKSAVHSYPAHLKILTTLAYVFLLNSHGRYEVAALMPFVIFPIWVTLQSKINPAPILRQLILASPFVLMVGIFNPFLETQTMLEVFGLKISGGMISFIAIILRLSLSLYAALLFVATTGIYNLCGGLQKLKVPAPIATQIIFTYRYIFVLLEEAASMLRARLLRSNKTRIGLSEFSVLTGQLLRRTMERATRMSRAMLCRNFDGAVSINAGEGGTAFAILWVAFFVMIRLHNAGHI